MIHDVPERPLQPPLPSRRRVRDEDEEYDRWRQERDEADLVPAVLDPLRAWPFARVPLTDDEWLRRAAEAAAKVIEERK